MLELLLAFAFLFPPVGFFWNSCGCCSVVAVCNGGCTSNPVGTSTCTITVSGVTNGFCARCSQMNGTWVCNAPGSLTVCGDAIETLFSPSSGDCLRFVWSSAFTMFGGNARVIAAAFTNGSQEYSWYNDFATAPATCTGTIGPLSMTTLVNGQVICTYSAATVTVEWN